LDGEIDELLRSIKDLGHDCSSGLQCFLAPRILLPRTAVSSLSKTTNMYTGLGVVLITHSGRSHKAGTLLLDHSQLIIAGLSGGRIRARVGRLVGQGRWRRLRRVLRRAVQVR
jgi:hypothetical protein